MVASLFTLGTDYFFSDVSQRWWGFYPEYRRPALIFLAFFAFMILAAVREFDRERRGAPTSLRRKRAGALLVAFSLAALATIDFLAALRLPIFPLGSVFVMAAIAVSAWTLQRYRFVGLAPEFVAQEVLATMADGLAVCDASGRIRVTNHGLRHLLGYAPGALDGPPIDVLVGGASVAETQRLRELLQRSQARDEEMTFRSASGSAILVSVASSHVRERHGSSVGTVLIARDTRERNRANQELKRYAQQQATLTEIGLEGLRCREPDDFIRDTAIRIAHSLQADRVDVLEFIDDTRRFHWVAGYDSSAEEPSNGARAAAVSHLAAHTPADDGVVDPDER